MKIQIPIRLRSSKAISVFLLSLFVLSSCDVYPESGKWSGEVSVVDERSRESYRCPISVDLTRTSEIVAIRSLDLDCGSRSLHWSPDAYTRRGTDLYKEGQKIGDIYPDGTVRLDIRDPYYYHRYPERVGHLVITWSRMGDSLHFSLREESEGQMRSLEGRLQSSI